MLYCAHADEYCGGTEGVVIISVKGLKSLLYNIAALFLISSSRGKNLKLGQKNGCLKGVQSSVYADSHVFILVFPLTVNPY